MSIEALSYMNSVINQMIRNYHLSVEAATNAVKNSFLYESLQENPEETMHDSIGSTTEDVYAEMFGTTK